MPCPVVFTDRNKNILIDVKGRGKQLRKDVDNIVVGVGAIVKLRTEGVLPLLRLQDMFCVRSMKNKTFKLKLA